MCHACVCRKVEEDSHDEEFQKGFPRKVEEFSLCRKVEEFSLCRKVEEDVDDNVDGDDVDDARGGLSR